MVNSLISQCTRAFEAIFVLNNMSEYHLSIVESNLRRILLNSHVDFHICLTNRNNANEARKIGLDLSKNDHVIFIDCDDSLSANDVLKTFIDIAKKHDPDVISCNIQLGRFSKENELIKGDTLYSYRSSNKLLVKQKFDHALISDYGTNIVGRLIRKSLLVDIEFTPLPFFQDWNITTKLYSRCIKFYFISEPLYIYVKNDFSISQFRQMTNEHLHDSFRCILDVHNYYKQQNTGIDEFVTIKTILFCVAYLKRASFFSIEEHISRCKRLLSDNNIQPNMWYVKHPKLLLLLLAIKNKVLFKAILKIQLI